VGENPGKYIQQYSRDFERDFLTLLRTSHQEKPQHLNRFYQEYISNKTHVHQNATRWNSLTEFARYLGRQGLCRVTEEEDGLYIAWIDNRPEVLARQDAMRKKERQDLGDAEREKRAIREQVERAHQQAAADKAKADAAEDEAKRALERQEGEKITLSFGAKKAAEKDKPSVLKPKSMNVLKRKRNPLG
jgi:DNA/RNA-binding protein KIN17